MYVRKKIGISGVLKNHFIERSTNRTVSPCPKSSGYIDDFSASSYTPGDYKNCDVSGKMNNTHAGPSASMW